MQHKSQRRPAVVLFFALVGMICAACSGPNLGDNTNAVVINNQTVSMSSFLSMTKLIESVSALNDASLPSWQLPRGRTAHQKAQQQALNLLATNKLVDSHAKGLLTAAAWARVTSLEDTQLKALFAQVPSQYKPLVDQGLLTPATYRPFIHQQIVEQQLIDPKNLKSGDLKVDVAHVKIITVKTQKQADIILDQIKKGTDWATLATQNSVDSAQAAGGDIAVLPAGYLPAEVDNFIFGKNAIALNTVYEMKKPSHLGYSLIEVLSRSSGIAVAALDNTQPIVTNAQISPQGAAINGLLTQWARAAQPSTLVNVNWCGNVGGAACPNLLTLDQQQ